LGVSLVFFTTVAVAVTAHYFFPMITWPLAFLLGAIISPPDAAVRSSSNEDKEEKELQLYVVNSMLHFIEYEFFPLPEERIRKELRNKYEQVAGKLVKEISTHTRNEKEEEQFPVRTLTAMQKAQIEVGRFQRELLLKLHKDGRFSDTAIRQVERDMDIDELKLNQLLPKEDQEKVLRTFKGE